MINLPSFSLSFLFLRVFTWVGLVVFQNGLVGYYGVEKRDGKPKRLDMVRTRLGFIVFENFPMTC